MKDFYTKEQIKLAKKVNLITLLKSRGEELATSGSEYVWLKGSDKVNVRDNLWYHHNEEVGGDTLDFVMKFYNMELTYIYFDFYICDNVCCCRWHNNRIAYLQFK